MDPLRISIESALQSIQGTLSRRQADRQGQDDDVVRFFAALQDVKESLVVSAQCLGYSKGRSPNSRALFYLSFFLKKKYQAWDDYFAKDVQEELSSLSEKSSQHLRIREAADSDHDEEIEV